MSEDQSTFFFTEPELKASPVQHSPWRCCVICKKQLESKELCYCSIGGIERVAVCPHCSHAAYKPSDPPPYRCSRCNRTFSGGT